MSDSKKFYDFQNIYNEIPNCKDTRFSYKDADIIQLELPFRILIVGGTGSMKTTWIFNLLKRMQCFTRIMVFAKVLDEKLYSYLRAFMKKVCKKKKDNSLYYESDDIETFPDFTDKTVGDRYKNDGEQTLVVVDDMLVEHQKRLIQAFLFGRKYNVSLVYISQSYPKVPKDLRRQCNYTVIKKQEQKDDLAFLHKSLSIPMKFSHFSKLYNEVNKKKENGILIDNLHNDPNYKIRVNLTPLNETDFSYISLDE